MTDPLDCYCSQDGHRVLADDSRPDLCRHCGLRPRLPPCAAAPTPEGPAPCAADAPPRTQPRRLRGPAAAPEADRQVGPLLFPAEQQWAELLAEAGSSPGLQGDARELAAGRWDPAEVRLARVAAWAHTCGEAHALEHAPGGLGATVGEVARARRWYRGRGDCAPWLAALYAAPAPPPTWLGVWSPAAAVQALGDSVAEGRARTYEAWVRAGRPGEDPRDAWTEPPVDAAARALGQP